MSDFPLAAEPFSQWPNSPQASAAFGRPSMPVPGILSPWLAFLLLGYLKIGGCLDFIEHSEEKLRDRRPPDAAAVRAKLEGEPALCAKAPCNCMDLGLMPIKGIDLALKARRNIYIKSGKVF
ncbi:MAG: hypothetical protein LBU32_00120 [Clostridiales bacterium]|nr:hypothetical protein [Clostridiales bacterium]